MQKRDIPGRYEDLGKHLPTAARDKGISLVFDMPEKQDPVYLRDWHEHDLFVWNYTPSQGEVFDKCRELGLME
jgi:hypothetical protein